MEMKIILIVLQINIAQHLYEENYENVTVFIWELVGIQKKLFFTSKNYFKISMKWLRHIKESI
jgi:hypothetical protein